MRIIVYKLRNTQISETIAMIILNFAFSLLIPSVSGKLLSFNVSLIGGRIITDTL